MPLGDGRRSIASVRTSLMSAQAVPVHLRPVSAADEPFLYELSADRRAPELRALGWGPGEQRTFVDMQFRAQQSAYAAEYPEADHWIASVGGDPVGRLLVDRRGAQHELVDLVVLSRFRALGIGTALVEEVLADAGAAGCVVRLTAVAHDQRLIRWYERLGFVPLQGRGPHVDMEARPRVAQDG